MTVDQPVRRRAFGHRNRRITATLAERLERRLAPPDEQGCRLWLGATNGERAGGYGQLQRGRRGEGLIQAHVAAFILGGGVIPPGEVVDHQCHNADKTCTGGACKHHRCCTFDHLRAVPNEVNIKAGRPMVPPPVLWKVR